MLELPRQISTPTLGVRSDLIVHNHKGSTSANQAGLTPRGGARVLEVVLNSTDDAKVDQAIQNHICGASVVQVVFTPADGGRVFQEVFR